MDVARKKNDSIIARGFPWEAFVFAAVEEPQNSWVTVQMLNPATHSASETEPGLYETANFKK